MAHSNNSDDEEATPTDMAAAIGIYSRYTEWTRPMCGVAGGSDFIVILYTIKHAEKTRVPAAYMFAVALDEIMMAKCMTLLIYVFDQHWI